MQPWQPSAQGWRVRCQELRKQDSVGSGGGHPRTCSKQAGPHLSHGLETGHGVASGRLQTRARDPSHMGPNKRCVDVHLNIGAVCADAVVMNEAQIILEIVLAAQSCLTTTPQTIAHQAPLWDSAGKNTGMGCHSLLQWIF